MNHDSTDTRRSDDPPGTWVGNVFFSDKLAERYLDTLVVPTPNKGLTELMMAAMGLSPFTVDDYLGPNLLGYSGPANDGEPP